MDWKVGGFDSASVDGGGEEKGWKNGLMTCPEKMATTLNFLSHRPFGFFASLTAAAAF